MPMIRIEVGGQSFDAPLPHAPVTIGAGEDADLRLQCDGVAATHCVLTPLPDGRHKLEDAGSGRATRVNGIVVKQVSLSEGDVLELGQARIVYSTVGGVPAPVEEMAPDAPAAETRTALPAKPAPPRAAPPRPGAPAPPPPPVPGSGLSAGADAAGTDAAGTDAAGTDAAGADASGTDTAGIPAHDAASQAVRRGERKAGKKNGALIGILIGVVVLGVIAFAVGGSGGSGGDPVLQKAYDEGVEAYEAKEYERARALWSRVARDAGTTPLASQAAERLRLIGTVESEIQLELDRLWSERLDLDAATFARRRTSFQSTFGEHPLPRFDALRPKVLQAQATWKREELARIVGHATALIATGYFHAAVEAWEKLGRTAPAGIDVKEEVAAALKQLLVDADAKAKGYVAQAVGWNAGSQAFRSVKLLEDMVPRFEGLAAQGLLVQALAVAKVARDKPIEIARTPPGRAPGEGPRKGPRQPPGAKPGIGPRPRGESGTGTPPPEDTTAQKEREARLLARGLVVRKEALPALVARHFQEAADVLTKALADFPESAEKNRLAGLAEDYVLAETGLVRLIATINEHPKRFGSVKITDRLTVSLIDADRELVSARVTGGSSKWRWERLALSAFPHLVKRMRPAQGDALPAAVLLHVLGLVPEAEAALYAAGEKGVPTTALFPVLARWRGEAAPKGGYVVYEQRYVTPAQKTFLLREARIAKALKQVDARESADRRAAYEDLLAVGEPAAKRLAAALRARRAFLIQEITSSRSFSSGKYMSKLLQLLDERRKHALALIYDAQAYPYPNPNKKNQKEVEARVDQVREVWERPFNLVAQWDKKLQVRLALVTEVDEYLLRVEEDYSADLDEITARINKVIDVPAAADSSKRTYSLSVLVYNTTLTTTATLEEKNNVRSVNDYRMMMGLLAVRINERLTRAARGHSRHMQTNAYFAHNVPKAYATPQNRTPGARCKVQGFGGGVGENIARGPGTGHGAFMAWFRSSGHHRNMLGRGWLQLGCGRAAGTWWTQNFGGGSKSLKQPDPLPAPGPAFAPDPEDENGRPVQPGKAEVPDEAPPGDPGEEDEEEGGADSDG